MLEANLGEQSSDEYYSCIWLFCLFSFANCTFTYASGV